jgi:hypothetical protein
MENPVKNKKDEESKSGVMKYWQDNLIHEFCVDYYNDLSAKELDQEFKKDIKNLAKILGKLPDSDRKVFINYFSNFVEFYIDQKVEKEIDTSIYKILKLL